MGLSGPDARRSLSKLSAEGTDQPSAVWHMDHRRRYLVEACTAPAMATRLGLGAVSPTTPVTSRSSTTGPGHSVSSTGSRAAVPTTAASTSATSSGAVATTSMPTPSRTSSRRRARRSAPPRPPRPPRLRPDHRSYDDRAPTQSQVGVTRTTRSAPTTSAVAVPVAATEPWVLGPTRTTTTS
jgi:hypothetical protein